MKKFFYALRLHFYSSKANNVLIKIINGNHAYKVQRFNTAANWYKRVYKALS